MTPVWIMGSNIDLSNPLMTSAERAKKLRDELLEKEEEKQQKKEFKEVFTSISDGLKDMLSGLGSLFGNGGTTTNTTGSVVSTTGATVNSGSTNTTSLITSNSEDPMDVLRGIDNSIGNTTYASDSETSENGSSIVSTDGGTISNQGVKATDKAVAWAVGVANDPRSGYDQANRQGPDYDCSSLVINAYEKAGIPVKSNGASYTGDMVSVFKNLGFTDVTNETSYGTDASRMMPGDVLWRKGHVEMYVGNGKRVGAHLAENGGAIAGQQGDQTGNEVSVTELGNGNWTTILRAPNTYTDGTVKDIISGLNSTGAGTTYGSGINFGTGSFIMPSLSEEELAKREAEEYWKNLREQGYQAIYKSKQNDVEEGKDIAGKTNATTSSWVSDYNDLYEDLRSFNKTNAVKFDSSKSVSGLQSIWDKLKNVDSDVSSSSFKPSSSSTNGSSATPNSYDDLPEEQTKYFTKLLEVLNLIQKNTSNIPKTNELLNEIIDLIDGAESDDSTYEGNIFNSLFEPIDGDINLIASGI